jgi:hypothetical protein
MGTSPVGLMLAAGRHTASGLGVPLALVLLVPMEAGIPIPIPADLVAALLAGAAAYWFVRRGRRRGGAQAMTEAACPLCLALNWVVERELTDRRASTPRPARAGG